MKPKIKPNVIFIGSFKEATKDGSVGGQMYACRSIINSDVSERINFLLIDSTVDTVPIPPTYKRILKVFGRFFLLLRYLLIKRVDKVLIFSSAGLSFIEKGFAVIICKFFFKEVIFAPRSGLIKNNVESSLLFRLYVKLVIRLSDKIICQGEIWKRFYQNICPDNGSKFIVIQNWIDVNKYINNRPVYNNRNGNASQLIYIGWLEEYKGILDLIEALSLIKDEIVGLKVHIYGSGKVENQARKMMIKYGLENTCIFEGRADYKTKLKALEYADFYVLPSQVEGFPNALLEAMASGLPSIACNVGSIAEIITHPDIGILVESRNIKELSDAIYQLYSDAEKRKILSENGRKKIIENNSLQIAEKKITKLLS